MSKPAEPRVIDVLVSSGVRLSVWHMPAELDEPKAGAPINYDDLLTFHEILQNDDWLQTVHTMVIGEDTQ